MVYILDTSVVVEREVSKLVKKGKISGKVFLPRAVMAELENQANTGRETGMIGLQEVQELQGLVRKGKIDLQLLGERPNLYQIKNAKRGGEIDSYIRDLAYNEGAVLVTADKIQAESAKALNVEVMFIVLKVSKKLELESFFDEHTMSVHLREGTFPYAKKGKPGNWDLVPLEDNTLTVERVQKIAREIIEKTRADQKSFIEISRQSSTIVQYKEYRIVIVKPPVADGWEITAVKPLVKLTLDKYNIPEVVKKRLEESSSGIIVSGDAGSGKSTFASAVAEHYASLGRITKTIESPRDLILSDNITQYSKNLGTSGEIHDIMFLTRPDNVIFDEMRDSPDFKLYIDIRLGGSALIGVLHAATPIDTIQRFIARMDVGMIPSVLDTILFIENGQITQVFTLKMVVKVPSGMTEADLARPVIEVSDLDSQKLMFEIYSYGEQTVVIPITDQMSSKSSAWALAEKQISNEFKRYTNNPEGEMLSDNRARVYVPKGEKAKIIGLKGSKITAIEKKIGISIDVATKEDTSRRELKRLGYHVTERGRSIIFQLDSPGLMVDVFVDDEFIFTSTTSKKGELKLSKKSDVGKRLVEALDRGRRVFIKG